MEPAVHVDEQSSTSILALANCDNRLNLLNFESESCFTTDGGGGGGGVVVVVVVVVVAVDGSNPIAMLVIIFTQF